MPVPSDPTPIRFRFPDGELDAWFALGDVTDRSVRVWARGPDGAVSVRLTVDGQTVADAEIRTDPTHDHVGAVVLEAPSAGREARFAVEALGGTRFGRFAPPPGTRSSFSFAFGSCHQPFGERVLDGGLQRHDGAAIYGALSGLLEERDARFVMLLGDQVYSDAVTGLSARKRLAEQPDLTHDELVDTYRHLHRGSFNERGFRTLVESVPAYMTWDDHDIFDGAGSLLHPTEIDRRLRVAAAVAYREYQHLRNPGTALSDDPPFSYSFWRGDVGFHVLDLRGCRDFHERRILGDEGWRRLDAFLAEADDRGVPTVFIGASVPVVHGSPMLMAALERLPTGTGKDIRDRWVVPHFRHEREALLDRLFRWQTAGPRRQVAILSGDVHVGAAFSVRPRRGRGRIAQWTSSALSTPSNIRHDLANRLVTSLVRLGEKDLRVWRRGLVAPNNAGLVEIAPHPDGGHILTYRCYAFDLRNATLRPALTDVAAPA